MRVCQESLLRVAVALRDQTTSAAAIRVLAGNPDPIAVDGLFEVVLAGPSARLVTLALAALEPTGSPLFRDAVRVAFGSPHAPVRLAAVTAVGRAGWDDFAAELRHVLRTDESWPNRRAAVTALSGNAATRWEILAAADDPHWRVRHALLKVLESWGETEPARDEIRAKLGADLRSRGLAAFLDRAWTGVDPAWGAFTPPDPKAHCPFWDWDPAVLAVKLQRFGKPGREAEIDAMPFLTAHPDPRVWKPAVAAIRESGDDRHFVAAVGFLGDPRTGAEARRRLFDGLPAERAEAFLPPGSPPEIVGPRLGADSPPGRAAALTPERAAELVADPHRETSWLVLEAACRIAKVPVWTIEPETPWTPPTVPATPKPPIAVSPVSPPHTAFLGRERLPVSRVGISGHYLLPADGFAVAADAGVNWFFWEPNYDTLTDFAARISPAARRGFHFVAGTFEADGAKIVRDAERAVRMLGVDRLGLFLIFWVQSWDRLTDDVRAAAAKLKRDGTAAVVGLSTHNRPLAVRAIADGWNPVMVRHSAAHRGAEDTVFPAAEAAGVTLLTFNNLCYGRMLKPVGSLPPPDAADCYRYSLSFPAVSACWSAPATLAHLDANLRALREPELPPDRTAALVRFGDALYREETAFRRLVREL